MVGMTAKMMPTMTVMTMMRPTMMTIETVPENPPIVPVEVGYLPGVGCCHMLPVGLQRVVDWLQRFV